MYAPFPRLLYRMKQTEEVEKGEEARADASTERLLEMARALLARIGTVYCYRRCFPGMRLDVSGCFSPDCLRGRLSSAAVGIPYPEKIGMEGRTMKIVIWKSPKALQGILRFLFGIKPERQHAA